MQIQTKGHHNILFIFSIQYILVNTFTSLPRRTFNEYPPDALHSTWKISNCWDVDIFKFGSSYMKQMRTHNLDWKLHLCYRAVVSPFSSSFSSSFKLPDGVDQIILDCREPGFLPMSVTSSADFYFHDCRSQWCNLLPPRTSSHPCCSGMSMVPATFLSALWEFLE